MIFKKRNRVKNYRKYERKDTLVLLNVSSMDDMDKSVRAAVINISVGGLAFESHQKFFAGERVSMRFTSLPGGRVQVIRGEVIRVSRRIGAYVYGVRFNKTGFLQRLRLRKTIWDISRTRPNI